eukprot:TRINITY_DN4168_c0_g1_i3.p3 TRINITY_DN4168_c0_g1~~TRINITY_DN4168_c0_g1_i3.p3  ORF type:complete len:183 (+),score=18.80 TRINITY_DN4168_c0_g1_i3:529-1077(+)
MAATLVLALELSRHIAERVRLSRIYLHTWHNLWKTCGTNLFCRCRNRRKRFRTCSSLHESLTKECAEPPHCGAGALESNLPAHLAPQSPQEVPNLQQPPREPDQGDGLGAGMGCGTGDGRHAGVGPGREPDQGVGCGTGDGRHAGVGPGDWADWASAKRTGAEAWDLLRVHFSAQHAPNRLP